MSKKKWNWRLWVGFLTAVVALSIYMYLGMVLNIRDIVWFSGALFVVSIALTISGLRRAYGQRESYRGQVAGPILALLGISVMGLFGLTTYEVSKHFAAARNAPAVGQAAPHFTLVDTSGTPVSLANVLASPAGQSGVAHGPKAVLLIFYRGYW